MNITIFVPLSRQHRITPIIRQINELDICENNVNILIGIDNQQVKECDFFGCKYPLRLFKMNGKQIPDGNLEARRQRIAEVFNAARIAMPLRSELVLIIEDDTDFKSDSLKNLLEVYKFFKNRKLGLISGLQAGRWGYKMVGAWKVDNIEYPKETWTLPYSEDGCEEVDATGLFFFITPTKNFIDTKFHSEDFGPDWHFGLDLRKKGLYNLVDWRVKVGHDTKRGLIYPDKDIVQVKYKKINNKFKLIK